MKEFLHNTWKHRAYLVLAMPAVLILFFFNYVPMAGLILAFKEFDFTKGIWGSPFNGIKNFMILIQSKRDFIRITRNTLAYYVVFTALGTVLNVTLAIAIDQCVFKRCAKVMQTIMIIPVFVSYAAVQFIVMAYLSANTGIVSNITGIKTFYTSAGYWPTILTVVKIWNSVGYGSVLYMSVLAGIDTSLYEAADIDGASKWQQIKYITLPLLKPTVITLFILIMLRIKRHYERVSDDLTISSVEKALAEINREKTARVIIPVQSLNKSFIKTLNCALSCGFSSMELYSVCSTEEQALRIREQIEALGVGCEFRYDVTTLRNTSEILLAHIRQEAEASDKERLIVMMGGLVVTSPFARILHNSTTHRLMRRMETYRNVYVFSVPYVIE